MLTKTPSLGLRPHWGLAAAFLIAFAASASAGDTHAPETGGFAISVKNGDVREAPRADADGPIGVMGAHHHGQGELMLSYRYMRMWMEGNLIGDNSVSPDTIVTTVPNRFFGQPMQPPTLRVVPTEMSMDMHMLGTMYGLTDRISLMGMVPLAEKDMHHITYAGPVGTTRLGTFDTSSDGIGDIALSGIVGLYGSQPAHHGAKTAHGNTHLNLLLGLSAPTGSITERGCILNPMGMRQVVRLPYAMQLGSGAWDFLPGLVYTTRSNNLSFGAQYRGAIRLEDKNDEGYALGDLRQATAWAQVEWAPWGSTGASRPLLSPFS